MGQRDSTGRVNVAEVVERHRRGLDEARPDAVNATATGPPRAGKKRPNIDTW